ncbi:MAG: DUF4388 domain-containing protein [Myxococcota bacterium]
MGNVIVDRDGVIRSADGTPLLAGPDDAWNAAIRSDDFIVLRRGSSQHDSRILMAGEVIHRMTIIEMISVIASSNWRGDFTVLGASERRTLSFDQAALKGATSTVKAERLSQVLYRLGMITKQQLLEVADTLDSDRGLAEALIASGHIDRERLFSALQSQAKQIAYGALLVPAGCYLFTTANENAPPETPMHLPIQGLLMEGVQRIDEMTLFQQRIPSTDLCPEITGRVGRTSLEPEVAMVVYQCDGNRSIEDIARATGKDLFETTKSIYHLLQRGFVELRSPDRLDTEAVLRLLSGFNEVMRDVFFAVATYGGVDQTHETLNAWIQGSGYEDYFGSRVEEDGSVQPERVLTSLRESDAENPVEALHQALHELAAFALFAATTSLPRDQELALARDVNRRLQAIRL